MAGVPSCHSAAKAFVVVVWYPLLPLSKSSQAVGVKTGIPSELIQVVSLKLLPSPGRLVHAQTVNGPTGTVSQTEKVKVETWPGVSVPVHVSVPVLIFPN